MPIQPSSASRPIYPPLTSSFEIAPRLNTPGLTREGVMWAMDSLLFKGPRPRTWREHHGPLKLRQTIQRRGNAGHLLGWAMKVMAPIAAREIPEDRARALYRDRRAPAAYNVLGALSIISSQVMGAEQAAAFDDLMDRLRECPAVFLSSAIRTCGDAQPPMSMGPFEKRDITALVFHPASTPAQRATGLGLSDRAPAEAYPGLAGVPGMLKHPELLRLTAADYAPSRYATEMRTLYAGMPVRQYLGLVDEADGQGDVAVLGRLIEYGSPEGLAALRPTGAQLARWLRDVRPDLRPRLIGLAHQVPAPVTIQKTRRR